MNEKLERAKRLAKRLGVRTRATTVRGILAAIRRQADLKPRVASRLAVNFPRREVTPEEVYTACQANAWQAGARVRLLRPLEPIFALWKAWQTGQAIGYVPAVPNAYRGTAYASVASALREGQAILIEFGRVECPTRPYGRGTKEIIPTRRIFVRRHKVAEFFRRHPELQQQFTKHYAR